MRYILIIQIALLLGACDKKESQSAEVRKTVQVPEVAWNASEVFYDRGESLWKTKSDSSTVSGKIKTYFQDGAIASTIPVFEGKKEGTQLTYFQDGKLRFLETYSNNKLNGVVKRWGIAEGYQLLAELNYENGRLHGEQKKWFASGELHKLMNMKKGKEHGLQKAYRKNGVLYANYEAVEGRTFGLRRSNLCFELNDEKVVYKQ